MHTRMLRLKLLTATLLLAILNSGADAQCVQRDYGNGGTVCVCNETYCDFYDELPCPQPGEYITSVSSKDGSRFNATINSYKTQNSNDKGVVLVVNPRRTYQEIEGFGGAMTDAAARNIFSLPLGAQEKLLQSYYGQNGNKYQFTRLNIGGCDFSTRPYSLDDTTDDVMLNSFALTEDDIKYKIPYLQNATAMSGGNLKLLGAAWSSPIWMKTSNSFTGRGVLRPEYYDVWAKYHLRFLEAYGEYGLYLWGISTGNEPSNGLTFSSTFNSLGWGPLEQGAWVANNLGPMLNASRFNATHIILLDDQRVQVPWWIDTILLASEASRNYVSGIGIHWYFDNFAPPSLLDLTNSRYPDLPLYGTEASITILSGLANKEPVDLGSWDRAESYCSSIIETINHWYVAWIDWNLCLDENGGPNWANNSVDAAIIVNATSGEFYKQPMFYAIGHFSQYVTPGYKRIWIEGATNQLLATAFLGPDNKIIVVMLNKNTSSQYVRITGIIPENIATFNVPPKSITTVILLKNDITY